MEGSFPSRSPDAERERILVNRYTPLAYSIARRYFLPGADRSDVRQEALLGLLSGIRSHDGHRPLAPFLAMVIQRKLNTAVRLANGRKHEHLNRSEQLGERVEGCPVDVLEALIRREEAVTLLRRVRLLTVLERRALFMVANGEPYVVAGVKDKAIDNALQRAKKKLREVA